MRKFNRDSNGRFAKSNDGLMDQKLVVPCGMIIMVILIFLFVITPLLYVLKFLYSKYMLFAGFGSLLNQALFKYVNTTKDGAAAPGPRPTPDF